MAILLNSNITTPTMHNVIDAMEPWRDKAIDLTSKAKTNQKALQAYHEAIDKIYASIHAKDEDTILLNSGNSEAISQIYFTIYIQYILTGRKNAIIAFNRCSIGEERILKLLESQGCRVHRIPSTIDGTIDLEILKEYINTKTALVSLPLVDEESGVIQPLEEVSQICALHGVALFANARDAMGRIPIDTQRERVDFLSFEGANIGGPKDIGALYIAKDAPELMPLIFGHQSEQARLRANIQDIAKVIGFAKALESVVDALDFEIEDTRDLRDKLEEELLKIPQSYSLSPWALRVPTVAIMAFQGVHGGMLIDLLAKKGILAYSFATYTRAHFERISLIELAKLDESLKHCTVGFSLWLHNSEEEIEEAIKIINETVTEIREISACKGE